MIDFDIMVCTDCWWNLPAVIAHRILQHPAKVKVSRNTWDTTKYPLRRSLAVLTPMRDIRGLLTMHKHLTRTEHRPVNVLIAGQGWTCGTHNETLGIKNLAKYVPGTFRVFVDIELIARISDELDRTMSESDMQDDPHVSWRHVGGTLYEMRDLKNQNQKQTVDI